MKAVRVYGPKDLRIEDIPVPTIGSEEVLVKIAYGAICATDIEIYLGSLGYIKQGIAKLPMTPGHEWSGTICDVGSEINYLNIGDKVCGENGLGCMHCERCLNGDYHLCKEKVGLGIFNKDGAFAEYLSIPARWIHKLKSNIDLRNGALVEPACVGCYAVETGVVNIGDTVLVVGDGSIGQFCVQFARIKGATKIIVIGSHNSKMEIAKSIGADYTIDRHSNNVIDEVMQLTNNEGIDLIIETSGNDKALTQCLDMVRKGSRIVVVSHYSKLPEKFNFNKVVTYNISIKGIISSPRVWDRVIRAIDAGQIKTKPMISGEFPMNKIESVLNKIMNRELIGLKYLIKP